MVTLTLTHPNPNPNPNPNPYPNPNPNQVPEVDDVNVSRPTVEANCAAFGFDTVEDIALYERLLQD